jgi:hypothetical protein
MPGARATQTHHRDARATHARPSHLVNAAAVLQAILRHRHPLHAWLIEVRELDRLDTERLHAAASIGQLELGVVGEHSHPVAERRTGSATTSASHDHGSQQAA